MNKLLTNGAGYLLDVVAATPGQLVIKILDIQGRIAKTIKETAEQGANHVALHLNDLQNGTYVLNIFNNETFVKAVRYLKN